MNIKNHFWHEHAAHLLIEDLIQRYQIDNAIIEKQMTIIIRFINAFRICELQKPCMQIVKNTATALKFEDNKFFIFSKPCLHGIKNRVELNKENRYLFRGFHKEFLDLDIRKASDIMPTGERNKILHFMSQLNLNQTADLQAVYLWGKPGTGKTRTFIALANYLQNKYSEKSFGFITAHQLIQSIKQDFNQSTAKSLVTLTDVQNVDVLFLDDFGSEPWTRWLRDDLYFSILNHRYINKKITFINSNFNLNQIAKMMGAIKGTNYQIEAEKNERIMRRIKAMTRPFKWTFQ